ncbi:MAG TPA: ATP-binding cassette domain-containing protein, partial [Acidimicrobiia bacterium]
MVDPYVETRELTYRVGTKPLVLDVTLRLYSGELTAVIGPNGAGKSTLLNLVGGMLRPSSGGVSLGGVDPATSALTDLARIRSILGEMAPSDLSYTAAQVVDMGRFPHRVDPDNTAEKDRGAVSEAMMMTDTSDLKSRIFSTLSRGEQTMVSLARVLAQATPVVLLDEPTTGLDIAHQERALTLAKEVCRARGRSVVAVLHDLNLAAAYADQVILMDGGRVIASGPPNEVLVADLLSEANRHPMVVVGHPFRDRPLVLSAGTPVG